MEREKTKCDGCSSESSAGLTKRKDESEDDFRDRAALARRMCEIRHKLLVLSGKGGVGKSTVAASLAVALAGAGRSVGVLDIDLHGPSIPRLLGVTGGRATGTAGSIETVVTPQGVRVMSMGFLLPNGDDALIWRGPLKYSMIRQFLRDVEWGRLDYLVIDSPPGTGDEPLSVGQLMEDADGAVLVTTPQALSTSDVRKSVSFARKLGLPILGIAENMSGFVCPECGKSIDVFGSGGGRSMAADMGVPFLGAIPIDPAMVSAGDRGALCEYLASGAPGAAAFADLATILMDVVESGDSGRHETEGGKEQGTDGGIDV